MQSKSTTRPAICFNRPQSHAVVTIIGEVDVRGLRMLVDNSLTDNGEVACSAD